MWEIVSQTPQPQKPLQQANTRELQPTSKETVAQAQMKLPQEHGYLLWGQILICVALGAAVFAARYCKAPFWPALRISLTELMQQENSLLGEERQLSRFRQKLQQAEQAWSNLAKTAKSSLEPTDNLVQPRDASDGVAQEQAPSKRIRHGKGVEKAAPAGCSTEKATPQWQAVQPMAGALVINSSYGWRETPTAEQSDESIKDFHTGVDLAAGEGTFVCAVANGVVQKAGYGNSYGYHVALLHPDGSQTIYAHLKYLFVHPGRTVAAGTPLGISGQTGNVTGPHLHFEYLSKGMRYDPTHALGLGG